MTTEPFTLEHCPACTTQAKRPAPVFSAKDYAVLALARRMGYRYGGSRPRYKGHTLIFHTGPVGTVQLGLKCPKKGIGRAVMRLLASGNAHKNHK